MAEKTVRRMVERLFPPQTRRRAFLSRLRSDGWSALLSGAGSPDAQYRRWVRRHALTASQARTQRRIAASFAYRPTISILTPLADRDQRRLAEAVRSVRGQTYENWELCVVGEGSGPAARLARSSQGDRRIKLRSLDRDMRIASALNAALEMASGEFVGFLDQDDELKPNALFEVVRLLNERRDLDVVYSDEDARGADGRLADPFFKPDWSPDLLMSMNYVGRFSAYRREILEQAGGFRPGFRGSDDYDLILRVSELTKRIAHIPMPLCTTRKASGPGTEAVGSKGRAGDAAERALSDAMRRRGFPGEVEPGLVGGRYRARYAIRGNPRVTIVVPTRDRVDLLRPCIESVEASTYANYEVVIVDNDSTEEATLAFLSSISHRVLRYPDAFAYARMMNWAVDRLDPTDLLLFLNNDTQVTTPDWIEAMLEHAQRPEVATVGARLFRPDGTPQHEGIIVGFAGGAAQNLNHGGHDGMGETIRNASAVTFACALVRREVYEELGGLEERLAVAFNDVDFCLRAREKGYEIVYTPYARLVHHERASRRETPHEEDDAFFRVRWGVPDRFRDPYYNPNFHPERLFRLRMRS